jgi:hypothetical protein
MDIGSVPSAKEKFASRILEGLAYALPTMCWSEFAREDYCRYQACESIYKAPTKRQDKKNEQDDVDMLADDVGSVSMQDDRSTNGYYIVILDNMTLESFVGPTFHHLCKAMKEVEAAKATNAEITAGTAESGPWICPVGGLRKTPKTLRKAGIPTQPFTGQAPRTRATGEAKKTESNVERDGRRAGSNGYEDTSIVDDGDSD